MPPQATIIGISAAAIALLCAIATAMLLRRPSDRWNTLHAIVLLLLGLSLATAAIRELKYPPRYQSSAVLNVGRSPSVDIAAKKAAEFQRYRTIREQLATAGRGLSSVAAIVLALGTIIRLQRNPQKKPGHPQSGRPGRKK